MCGTYWYHSHAVFQQQAGACGAVVVDQKEPEPFCYDRDFVAMLPDSSDDDWHAVYAKLKTSSHDDNFRECTVIEAVAEAVRRTAAGRVFAVPPVIVPRMGPGSDGCSLASL